MVMNKFLKIRNFVIAVLCVAPFCGFAQSSSKWLTSEAREANYPADVYVWELAVGNKRSGETNAALLERLKDDAKKGAAGKIRTMIEAQSEKSDWQATDGENYNFASVYQDYTKQTVQAEITGFKIETYYDELDQTGYAFAYVKKSELETYYKSQITLQLQQVQNALTTAGTAANAGQKMRALKGCENALQPLAKAEFAQDLLSAVAPSDVAGMQMDKLAELKNALLQQLIDLEQSIYIYIVSKENNFGASEKILEPELKRILSKNNCSFTTDPAQADFKITLNATTRKPSSQSADNNVIKFAYADVDIELYSSYKKMEVYSDRITQKNDRDGGSYPDAGRNALKLSATKVWEGIKPWILGQ